MLEYAFIEGKEGKIKIKCSESTNSLPDFSAMGITANEYEGRLQKYQNYLDDEARREAIKRKFRELCYGNIDLFMERYDEIVDNPQYANIMLPEPLFGSMYAQFSGRKITLGELLRIYKNEPEYAAVCPKCRGKLYLTSFGFSPLSGRTFPTYRCFGECREIHYYSENSRRCTGIELRAIRLKYSPMVSDIAPVDITELLRHLGKKTEFIEGFYEDNSVGGMYIGKSKQLVTFVEKEDGTLSMKRVAEVRQIKADIIVPKKAWTFGFTAQILLQNTLYFGKLPDKIKCDKAFLRHMINNTDWIPQLGTISPKHLTAEACIRAIKANPHKRKSLLKLVPEHLSEEVEAALSQLNNE